MDCSGCIYCLQCCLSSVACCWTCVATQPEFTVHMGGKASGLHLLKGFCLSAKFLTHAICFEDGDVNGYDPPEARPCRQRVCVWGLHRAQPLII